MFEVAGRRRMFFKAVTIMCVCTRLHASKEKENRQYNGQYNRQYIMAYLIKLMNRYVILICMRN